MTFLFTAVPTGAPSLGVSETPTAAPNLGTSKKPSGGNLIISCQFMDAS